MTEKACELLLSLYNHPHVDKAVEYRYSNDPAEKSAELRAFKELQELGYITKEGSAIGFIIVSITDAGKYAATQL